MLTRDQLIQPHTKEIDLAGGKVVIRELTADEAIDMDEMDIRSKEIYQLISKSFFDPELSVDDVGKLPATVIKELIEAIFVFNGMTQKAIADAVEELKKTQISDSLTE